MKPVDITNDRRPRSHALRRLMSISRMGASVVACCVVMLLVGRATAFAHAALVRTEPAAGARLATSPDNVRLVFSEELDPTLAQLSLVSDDGSVTKLVVGGDPHDVYAIIAPVAKLATGAYRVMWRIVSADGHPVEGSFVFSVGNTTAQAPAAPPNLDVPSTWGPTVVGAPIIPAALRGIGVGFLMAFAGLIFCLVLAHAHGELPQRRARKIARWLALGAVVFLALNFAAWLLNASPDHSIAITGSSTRALLSSNIGRMESCRTGLALLALWAIALARRPRMALVFAFLALVVSGASGHSAAMHQNWTEPARALHLLAGGAWLGSLIYLIAHERQDTDSFARAAFRVSTIALVSAIVVTITGVIQGLFFLPSPLDIFGSAYGTILLAKMAGLLVLIAFGTYHRYRVLPGLVQKERAAGRFTMTLRSEIAVMIVVVMLGGLLAYVSPQHQSMAGMASMEMHSNLSTE
ncbi:MAG: copper resistance protein CopC [Gemmatimonadaceae bacterium]